MKFQHTTITQTLTTSTQKKAPKRRKGLSEEVIQERFNDALANYFRLNSNGEVIGRNNRPLTTKINNRLAITFRGYEGQVHIYQEDFIRLYIEKYGKPKPYKRRYTAKEVSEYLKNQANKEILPINPIADKAIEDISENVKKLYQEFKLTKPSIEEVIGYSPNETNEYIKDLEIYNESLWQTIQELHDKTIIQVKYHKKRLNNLVQNN